LKISNAFKSVSRRSTPKGAAGYDNPRENIDPHIRTKVVNTKESYCDMMRQRATWHAYGGFQDVAEVIAIGVQNTWYHITNATNDLWTGLHANGLTLINDTMIIANTGNYYGNLSISMSGLAGKDFQIRLYNTTTGVMSSYHIGASTKGLGNFTCVSLSFFMEAIAGDVYRMEIRNITDLANVTLKNATFFLNYLHD